MRAPTTFLALLDRIARRPMAAIELELLRHRLERKERAALARGARKRGLVWRALKIATDRRAAAAAMPRWRSTEQLRREGMRAALHAAQLALET